MRLFNTVGPRQTGQYGMVIPNFVRQALAGQPITVFGDGTQTRSFTYVGRRRRRAGQPDGRAARGRPGLQHRQRRGDLDSAIWPSASSAMTGSSREIVTIPYDQAYEAGLRGHAAARARPRRRFSALIGYEPTVELDEILAA